jgi:hypothetical protein
MEEQCKWCKALEEFDDIITDVVAVAIDFGLSLEDMLPVMEQVIRDMKTVIQQCKET